LKVIPRDRKGQNKGCNKKRKEVEFENTWIYQRKSFNIERISALASRALPKILRSNLATGERGEVLGEGTLGRMRTIEELFCSVRQVPFVWQLREDFVKTRYGEALVWTR